MYNLEYLGKVGGWRWLVRNLVRQLHKRVLRTEHSMKLPSGAIFPLPLNSHLASEAYVSSGDIDDGCERMFLSMIKPGGVVYDVGANIGYYSVYVSPVVSKCYAFEPSPKTSEVLRRVVAPFPNIVHVPLAVSSSSRTTMFYEEPSMEVSGLKARTENARPVPVKVTTLDDFSADARDHVDAIKIDVEGYDLEVLKGSRNLIARDQPLILTEAKADERLFAFSEEVGCRVFTNVWRGRQSGYVTVELSRTVAVTTKMIFLVPPRIQSAFEQIAYR